MAALDDFVNDLTSPACLAFCAERSQIPAGAIKKRLDDYAAEVHVGARLLRTIPLEGRRVLEVGAGLGLLSVWLKRQGVSVTLLEPGAGGFSENYRLMSAMLEWLGASDATVLPIGAEELDPNRHGTFDVICSVNVLEHIPRLEPALEGMLGVLATGGVMRHTCANYMVPYEPHYGVPLVPIKPRWSASLYPSLARQELWQSFNFVTYDRVARFCRAHGLTYRFDGGLMADAFKRIDEDPAFRRRHGRAVRSVQRLLSASRLLSLLALVPPRWATPMAFSCWRSD